MRYGSGFIPLRVYWAQRPPSKYAMSAEVGVDKTYRDAGRHPCGVTDRGLPKKLTKVYMSGGLQVTPAMAPSIPIASKQIREFMTGDRKIIDDGACYRDLQHNVPVNYVEAFLPPLTDLMKLTLAELRTLAWSYDVATSGKKSVLVARVRTAARARPKYDMLVSQKDANGVMEGAAILNVEGNCLFITLICARKRGKSLLQGICDFAKEYNYSGVSLTAANFFLFKFYSYCGFRVSPNHANLARQLKDYLPDDMYPYNGDLNKAMRKVASMLLAEQRENKYARRWDEFEKLALSVYADPFYSGIPMAISLS